MFDFTRGRSIVKNLKVYIEFIIFSNLSEKLDVYALHTDFSKAFDLANYKISLINLRTFGIFRNLLNSFFKTYFFNFNLLAWLTSLIACLYALQA